MNNYFSARNILEKAIGTDAYFQIKSILTSTKATDVAPVKHGRWIDAESDDGRTVWHCSKCSYPIKTIGGYPIYKYCPMCGARMGKEDGHEVS